MKPISGLGARGSVAVVATLVLLVAAVVGLVVGAQHTPGSTTPRADDPAAPRESPPTTNNETPKVPSTSAKPGTNGTGTPGGDTPSPVHGAPAGTTVGSTPTTPGADPDPALPSHEPTQPPTKPSPKPTPTLPPPAPKGFPNAGNTGVPANVRLTAYKGPCTITAAGTVINAKSVGCDLEIRAANVMIKNSRIAGSVATDEGAKSFSFTIQDSNVDVGSEVGTGIGATNFTARRVEVTGGNRSINCWLNCVVQDSYVHGQFKDSSGATHESGIRMGSGGRIIHNSILCDAPDVAPDGGCSANLTGYGDFGAVQDMLIQDNLMKATTGGTCAYGGSSGGKPYSSATNNIRFIGNVFERGPTGNCGYWAPIMDFEESAPGNEWSGNVWATGGPVNP